ncbi:hypothetical protein GC310_06500, partial [Yersinia pestis]|nr:hypothetical protein [Yersinia pestis]MBE7740558.1 hypothetical protein [Yersinia pestis]MBE7744248.1 hypothetical protein [Yersinia pestis]MBE7748780.1 hypothetical protein [Yersinia pestis]MBE7765323.1 hypothetical protein [Yersinia pestis]
FSQFSRKCFKFLFVHNLPVSVVGVKISKTGNYTILFTVSESHERALICSINRTRRFVSGGCHGFLSFLNE